MVGNGIIHSLNKPAILFYLLSRLTLLCLFSLTPHASALHSVTGAPPRLDEHIARVTEAPPSLCLGYICMAVHFIYLSVTFEGSGDALKKCVLDLVTKKGNKTELQLGFRKPAVIIIVRVNGGGKTTSLGKLAHRLKKEGAKLNDLPRLDTMSLIAQKI
ncbi:hypothetical protein ACSBR1_019607 [Camellia fascicularis]